MPSSSSEWLYPNSRVKIDTGKREIWVFKNESWKKVAGYNLDNNWNLSLKGIDNTYATPNDMQVALQAISNDNSRVVLPERITIDGGDYVYKDGNLSPANLLPDLEGSSLSPEDKKIITELLTKYGPTTSARDTFIYEYLLGSEKAKKENEGRYNDALSELSGLRDRTMSNLSQLGLTERLGIEQNAKQAVTSGAQSLVSKGLSNTTTLPVLKQSVDRQKQTALQQLAQNVNQQKTDLDTNLVNSKIALLQSKTDLYPDSNQFASLLSALGGV